MAATFKDSRGREWTVLINGRVLVRARNHGKINISDLFSAISESQERGQGIRVDPALLLDLCFYGCEHNSKIQSRKVDKDDFLEALSGEAIPSAIQATAEALTECFSVPSPKDESAECPTVPPEAAR